MIPFECHLQSFLQDHQLSCQMDIVDRAFLSYCDTIFSEHVSSSTPVEEDVVCDLVDMLLAYMPTMSTLSRTLIATWIQSWHKLEKAASTPSPLLARVAGDPCIHAEHDRTPFNEKQFIHEFQQLMRREHVLVSQELVLPEVVLSLAHSYWVSSNESEAKIKEELLETLLLHVGQLNWIPKDVLTAWLSSWKAGFIILIDPDPLPRKASESSFDLEDLQNLTEKLSLQPKTHKRQPFKKVKKVKQKGHQNVTQENRPDSSDSEADLTEEDRRQRRFQFAEKYGYYDAKEEHVTHRPHVLHTKIAAETGPSSSQRYLDGKPVNVKPGEKYLVLKKEDTAPPPVHLKALRKYRFH